MARRPLPINVKPKHAKMITELAKHGAHQSRVILRALALRQLGEGRTAPAVAENIPLTAKAIREIAHRCNADGLDAALCDKQRPGAKQILDDSQKQRIVAMVCGKPPEGRARWTVRLVAEEAVKRKLAPRAGRETIRVLLQSRELKPWREKKMCAWRSWTRNTSGRWRTRQPPMRSRAIRHGRLFAWMKSPFRCTPPCGLRQRPSRKASQAGQRVRTLRHGERVCRGGSESRAALHGGHSGPCGRRVRPNSGALGGAAPLCTTIHLGMDNLNIHCRKPLVEYFGEWEGGYIWDRFTVHYAPKHGSWLNQAEIELSLYSRQCLGKRRISQLDALRTETKAWNRAANQRRTKINWRFTRRKARKLFGCAKPGS